jgi:hypothetical protein
VFEFEAPGVFEVEALGMFEVEAPGVFLIGAGRWRALGMCGRCLACAAACEGT